MRNLFTYLIFKGNCKQALEFYSSCLEGEIVHITTFKESPLQVKLEQEQLIFDAELKIGTLTIKASDSLPENKITIGTNFSLFITFETFEELKTGYERLSKEGKVLIPLTETPDNPKFCMISDKFDIQWMLTTTE